MMDYEGVTIILEMTTHRLVYTTGVTYLLTLLGPGKEAKIRDIPVTEIYRSKGALVPAIIKVTMNFNDEFMDFVHQWIL